MGGGPGSDKASGFKDSSLRSFFNPFSHKHEIPQRAGRQETSGIQDDATTPSRMLRQRVLWSP